MKFGERKAVLKILAQAICGTTLLENGSMATVVMNAIRYDDGSVEVFYDGNYETYDKAGCAWSNYVQFGTECPELI